MPHTKHLLWVRGGNSLDLCSVLMGMIKATDKFCDMMHHWSWKRWVVSEDQHQWWKHDWFYSTRGVFLLRASAALPLLFYQSDMERSSFLCSNTQIYFWILNLLSCNCNLYFTYILYLTPYLITAHLFLLICKFISPSILHVSDVITIVTPYLPIVTISHNSDFFSHNCNLISHSCNYLSYSNSNFISKLQLNISQLWLFIIILTLSYNCMSHHSCEYFS